MEVSVTSSSFNGLIEREVMYSEVLKSGHVNKVVVRVWLAPNDSVAALNTDALAQAASLLLRAQAAHPA